MNGGGPPPSADELKELADTAMTRLPAQFAAHTGDVVVKVQDFAEEEVLRELGIADPWELSGLYHGRPIDQRSIWESGELPPMVTLYRLPLLAEWVETGGRLDDLIFHVVVHEIGHHFGLSDADMHRIEDDAG